MPQAELDMLWWILWNADNHGKKSVFLLLYWSYWTICSDLPGQETWRQRRYLQNCTLACCSGPSKSQQHTESLPLVSSQQNCHSQRGCCCQVQNQHTHRVQSEVWYQSGAKVESSNWMLIDFRSLAPLVFIPFPLSDPYCTKGSHKEET